MSNPKNMTEKEVRTEVIKLIKQKDDLIHNYCLSVSPYKVGDKLIDRYGRPVIILGIEPNHSFFENEDESNYSYMNFLFKYYVCELKKDGNLKVHGYRFMLSQEVFEIKLKEDNEQNDK
jgi:hypothetical protein